MFHCLQAFAHRTVLSAASPVFFSHLQHSAGPMSQLCLDTMIEECTPQDMFDVLKLIYSGQISLCESRLTNFMNVTKQLQLHGFNVNDFHAGTVSHRSQHNRNNLQYTTNNNLNVQSNQHIPLTNNDYQQFIPQIPIPMPGFSLPDNQTLFQTDVMESSTFSDGHYLNPGLIQNNIQVDNDISKLSVHQDYPKCPQINDAVRCEASISLNKDPIVEDSYQQSSDFSQMLLEDDASTSSNKRPFLENDMPCLQDENSNPKDYSCGNRRCISDEVFTEDQPFCSTDQPFWFRGKTYNMPNLLEGRASNFSLTIHH